MTCCLAIRWEERCIILDFHLVHGVGHTEVGPKAHLVGKNLVKPHLKLITAGSYLTQVGCRSSLTEVRRNRTGSSVDKDIGTSIVEEIYGTGEQATQETIVYTHIHLFHLLPVYVLVTYGRFTIPGIWRISTGSIHLGCTTICPLRHVKESVAHIIVTDFTIGSTDLHHIQNLVLTQIFHERLLGNHPSNGTRTKEGETVIWRELL